MSERRSSPATDPLVPIRQDRLETARKHAGLSVRALALKAGIRQQTLDAMRRDKQSGQPRHCRRSNRDRLAEALGLPRIGGSLWLGGQIDYLLDSVRRLPGGGGLDIRLEKSPTGVQLARYHLVQRCLDAWAQDAEKRSPGSVKPSSALQPSELRQRFFVLQEALTQLTEAFWWRGQLLEPEVPEDEVEGEADDGFLRAYRAVNTHPVPTDPKTQEKIEMALIAALEGLLEPWFEGKAELNYENLLALGSRPWWEPFSASQGFYPPKESRE